MSDSSQPASAKFPFCLVLDNVRSALNVGAIFRTCDGAAAEKLYLCGITPYPPHNRIPKTALGAEEYVEWERRESCLQLVRELKEQGYTILAAETDPKAIPFNEFEFPEKCAIVLGHELGGVSPDVLSECQHIVSIPMFGRKGSLNVATTAGILAYSAAMYYDKHNVRG